MVLCPVITHDVHDERVSSREARGIKIRSILLQLIYVVYQKKRKCVYDSTFDTFAFVYTHKSFYLSVVGVIIPPYNAMLPEMQARHFEIEQNGISIFFLGLEGVKYIDFPVRTYYCH